MYNQKIAIIGCGRVGVALAVFLSKAGYRVAGFASRSRLSAQNALKAILSEGDCCKSSDLAKVFDSSVDAASLCDILFITTPDNLIQSVCSDISSNSSIDMSSKTIFHCSGALSSCVLESAAKKGANTGSIHPLQSFAPYSEGEPSPFIGINVSVEGNHTALAVGKELIHALGANHFTIPTKSKTLYHAAAVVASNYLVTLEAFALELLNLADISQDKGYQILEPLIQGTLSNIKTRGSVAALTGPIARGDFKIVEQHLKDIDERLPDFSKLYRIMGQYTLKLTQKRGELDASSICQLTETLK
ncbi:MAG: DUF2520 domain-containing protein [Desulfamplus sp.]|nr:DUF2520 domain-containing protein [Desulfamplus sp.]